MRIIEWLRACYLSDRAWSGISSLRSEVVEHHRVIGGEEVLAIGLLDQTVVAPEYAETVRLQSQLYAREKELLYGCISVCGLVDKKPVVSPLLIYPAVFDAESAGILSIKTRQWRFNPRALEMLQLSPEAILDLTERMSEGIADSYFISGLEKWLQGSKINDENLCLWPKLLPKNEIVPFSKKKGITLLASAHLFLAKRSKNTRGVLQELSEIITGAESVLSKPLNCLFSGVSQKAKKEEVVENFHYTPSLLSEAQNKVLSAAKEQVLSVCHGPPGTGKSYTISAMAIDHVVRGESVLIVSQQDAAVDVVCEKIDEMAGGEYLTVRGARGNKGKKSMRDFLEKCLAEGAQPQRGGSDEERLKTKLLKKTLSEMSDLEDELEKEMKDAVKTGGLLTDPALGVIRKIYKYWKLRNFEDKPLLADLQITLEKLQHSRNTQTMELMKIQLLAARRKVINTKTGYKSLKTFLSALKARKGSVQAERFSKVDHGVIRKVFPIWLVALDDLHGVVPLEKEMYDLVIIDEASQCDLAQVLPALHRAKRAVIVGDKKQLKHVSFLSQAKQLELAQRYGLSDQLIESFNYRNRSLMDVAVDSVDDSMATSLLNEHYRSRADIIDFSNEQFYGGGMHVMSHKPWESQEDGLLVIPCHGVRDSNGVNQVEVDKVIELLMEYANRDCSATKRPSLGVVSPFRNQVDAIRKELTKQLAPELLAKLLHEHKLKVETSHGFQGDEREVMILSLVVDSNSPYGSRRFLERQGVFNVMVSRARRKQFVLSSVEVGMYPGTLLGDYLMFCNKPLTVAKDKNEHLDVFVTTVKKILSAQYCEVWSAQEVAGVEVDLVVRKGEKILGIDLIGYPGSSIDYLPLEMMRLLSRTGMRLLPIGYAEWVKRPEDCIKKICELI